MCLGMSVPYVHAADPTMNMSWYGDYSDNDNPKLIIKFNSQADYLHQVTAVVYPTGADATFDNYIRMDEFTVNGQTETTYEYVLNSDFSSEDSDGQHAYTVKLQGNGYRSNICVEAMPVYVINKTEISGLLVQFAAADETSLSSLIAEVRKPLQLENATAPTQDQIETMYSVKADDFNNKFETLEDIGKSWNIADVLVRQKSASADGIKTLLETYQDILEINLTETDLSTNFDEVCTALDTYGNEFNNSKGICSKKDLKTAIGNYLGVIMINDATTDTISTVFDKYSGYFDIPQADLEKYGNLNEADQGKVMQTLHTNKTATAYNESSEIVDDFSTRLIDFSVDQTIEDDDDGDDDGGNDGGGNDGGGGGGGGAEPPKNLDGEETNSDSDDSESTDDTESVPDTDNPTGGTVSEFSDVGSENWASEFITELAKAGVINGYDDGTFRPDNNVTREEFVKIIICACGLYNEYASGEFTDMSEDSWFYKYVASAVESGIIGGMDDGSFGVGRNITRQDVAVIVARVIEYLIGKQTVNGDSTLTDLDTASDYAEEAIILLHQLGIINGYDDGSYLPFNSLTRAEAAAIMSKLLDVI